MHPQEHLSIKSVSTSESFHNNSTRNVKLHNDISISFHSTYFYICFLNPYIIIISIDPPPCHCDGMVQSGSSHTKHVIRQLMTSWQGVTRSGCSLISLPWELTVNQGSREGMHASHPCSLPDTPWNSLNKITNAEINLHLFIETFVLQCPYVY